MPSAVLPRHRTRPDAGWVAQRRGPTGGGPCRLCGLPVEKGRRTFHAVCAEHWLITSNPGHVRRLLFDRDRGVCCRCGLDCQAMYAELSDLFHQRRRWSGWYCGQFERDPAWPTFLLENDLRRFSQHRSFWDAHHRHAVAEGGGLCELDGFETLCWRCHRVETAALRKRLRATKSTLTPPEM